MRKLPAEKFIDNTLSKNQQIISPSKNTPEVILD
jgi:hypothetical protein